MQYQQLSIPPAAPFPNSSLPVILYPGCQEPRDDLADAFLRLFQRNGWGGGWVNGVYSFHHFHAAAHEALGCARGWVTVRLGGPQGQDVTLRQGDAVLLPAGVGHFNMEASPDYVIVGAYPPGQSPDLQRGSMADYERLRLRAAAVPPPSSDPVLGQAGGILDVVRQGRE